MPLENDTDQDRTPAPFPIVGVGASAGGLEALQIFASEITVGSGIAYVIVQHLSPTHKSIMDQLLQAKTRLEVLTIEHGMAVEPDKIYVAPAAVEVSLCDDVFQLAERDEAETLHLPIDNFFSQLARSRGRDAYCVILSGTGSDGTAGMKAVKAAGGVAIVQELTNARFPGMPESAVATGLVDFILNAREIPARLHDLVQHRSHLDTRRAREDLHAEIEDRLGEFTELLGDDHGHEFSEYKPGTLVRRIERRMNLLRIASVDGFLAHLRTDTEETNRLVQDFLIGVTQFNRDPAAFDALRETVIVPMMDDRTDPCRVWVPGCSTGEEAYSIAIMLMEEAERSGITVPIQVFGTDIDTAALAFARAGVYSPSAVSALPQEHIERYFALDNGRFRASGKLREACVFAPHNLIQDPPFSRLDLISCRNLLIYMKPILQSRIIPRFHFALKPGGYLFLGPSEGLSGGDSLFDLIDQGQRIFLRNDKAKVQYSPLTERPLKAGQAVRAQQPFVADILDGPQGSDTLAERSYLSRFAQPFALVTNAGDIVYLSEKMTQFVRPTAGVPSTNIDAFLTRELRLPIRSALSEARENGETAYVENIVAEHDGVRRIFDVMADPLDPDSDHYLIVITQVRLKENIGDAIADRQSEDRMILENEVVSLRKQLNLTLSEFASSSQELKSSNEELLSMNEELQSSNEELETSREELQSINEELETVNAELSEYNALLTRANSDFKNLFESTDIAVLFLDSQLCVRRFTPKTTRIFGIRDRDDGRPIKDLSSRIHYPELEGDAEEVRRSLQTKEREVGIEATGERFVLRIRPYRTTDDRLDGFVLTFFDITERQRHQELLAKNAQDMARQYAELENLYDTTPVGLALMDKDLRFLRINKELADINGYPPDAHIGKTMQELLPDVSSEVTAAYREVFETGAPVLHVDIAGETPAKPGQQRFWIGDYYPVRDESGKTFAVGACVREVTEEKNLLRRVEESEARLRRVIDNAVSMIGVYDRDGRLSEINRTALEASGVDFEALKGKQLWETYWFAHSEVEQERVRMATERAQSGETHNHEMSVQMASGQIRRIEFQLAPILDEDGEVMELVASGYDITARRKAEDQLKVLLGELQHRVKNTLATVSAVARFLGRGTTDVSTYMERFQTRLGAISRTHDLLTSGNWEGAQLSSVIAAEAAPFAVDGRQRVRLDGADLQLGPEEVLSIGMAVHELMTNSVKYGALSVEAGHVEVDAGHDGAEWTTLPRTITWRELGGPEVAGPTREGFGSFLINRVLAENLNGEVELAYDPSGVRCHIALPERKSILKTGVADG